MTAPDPTAGERCSWCNGTGYNGPDDCSHRSGGPAMSPVDWDSETWGQLGHNIHEAAWAADGTHDDVTEDQ